jgi:hypothetical protein
MDGTPYLNDTLQEIIDHHEIKKVLNVYCHGCDRGDEPRMASIYAEESWDNHGFYRGPGKPFAKQVMDRMLENEVKFTHLLGQSQIKVTGDEAGAETYFIANGNHKNDKGQEVVDLMGGRFVDKLVREFGQWKVKDRVVVRDWSISLDAEKDWLEEMDFVEGQLSQHDPSYAVLGLLHPGLPPGAPPAAFVTRK